MIRKTIFPTALLWAAPVMAHEGHLPDGVPHAHWGSELLMLGVSPVFVVVGVALYFLLRGFARGSTNLHH